MNHYKDITKAMSVVLAAAIISSIGTVSTMNTNTGGATISSNTMISSPSNISLEDVEAALQLKKQP